MLAENLADVIPAHEPQSVVPLSLVGKDGSGGDGRVPGAASEPVDGGKGDELEGAVRMEIEGDGDGDFTVEDEAEQVSNGSIFVSLSTTVKMHGQMLGFGIKLVRVLPMP